MDERRESKSSTLRVKLRYPDVATFLVKYGPNLSRGGVFIGTKTPKAVGTSVRFDFVLVHDDVETSVLRGEGVVHFVREPAPDAPSRTPGMGLRFMKLYDDGQALVDRALALRAGAKEPEGVGPQTANIREVTGEVELVTGPARALEPAGTDELDALIVELGIAPDRVAATLQRRRRTDVTEDGLLALLERPTLSATTAEALLGLDALLKRR